MTIAVIFVTFSRKMTVTGICDMSQTYFLVYDVIIIFCDLSQWVCDNGILKKLPHTTLGSTGGVEGISYM